MAKKLVVDATKKQTPQDIYLSMVVCKDIEAIIEHYQVEQRVEISKKNHTQEKFIIQLIYYKK